MKWFALVLLLAPLLLSGCATNENAGSNWSPRTSGYIDTGMQF